MADILYLDTNQALADFVAGLKDRQWLALDTEFMRERSYFPKLCLIQVGDGERTACVDPLAIDELEPLQRLLQAPNVLKVLHSAEQDMGVLAHTLGAPPRPLFDTQIAAALCGYGDQIGYANLVRDMLGVELAKAHTRADWARRPLKPAEIEYAADDVRHLGALYQRLQDELRSRDRLDWLQEDAAALTEAQRYRPDPAQAWRRLQGLAGLNARDQHLAAELAAWREEQAVRADLPRRWVLDDAALLELARRKPADRRALERLDGVKPGFCKRHGEAVLEVIRRRRDAVNAAGLAEATQRLEAEQKDLLDRLRSRLKRRARELDISPALLANRRQLESLVRGDTDLPLLSGWRREAAGAQLLRSLEEEEEAG